MTNPQTCKVDYGKEKKGRVNISGSLNVVWNHKHGEPTDVVGFEIFVEHKGDSICFQSAEQHTGNSEVIFVLEEILGESLVDAAGNHCNHEPPTDGTIQEQIDYQKNIDDFYPPMPRG
jgi:hypothetical protein